MEKELKLLKKILKKVEQGIQSRVNKYGDKLTDHEYDYGYYRACVYSAGLLKKEIDKLTKGRIEK